MKYKDKIEVYRKIIYLHEKEKNKTISDDEKKQLYKMYEYCNELENAIDDIINKHGYRRNTAKHVYIYCLKRECENNPKMVFKLIFIIILVAFTIFIQKKDKKTTNQD